MSVLDELHQEVKRLADPIKATFYFIKKGECDPALQIAKILINDKEDLIHKAVGLDVKRNWKSMFTRSRRIFS